ncbi:MAG TPA: prepilin peptidase, partial [Planctomycetes bacterium]|nr:prepilin peptidase [Planctomycetota bacterium]
EPGGLGHGALVGLRGALVGMAVGSGVVWTIGRIGSLAFGKEAMGFGDVKLMAFLGAILGPVLVLAALLLACLIGSVVGLAIRWRTGSSYIPFGPFLCTGAALLLLARPEMNALWQAYLGLLGS